MFLLLDKLSKFIMYIFIIIFYLTSFVITGCSAENTVITKAYPLSSDDKTFLHKVEERYNQYKSIKSHFVQKDSLGHYTKGWFVLSKPNKLRIEYYNLPIRFIVNGSSMLYQDLDMKTKSFIPINTTPLHLLLKEKVSFTNSSVVITDIKHTEEYTSFAIKSANQQQFGTLVLYFDNTNADLIKWEIIDINSVITELTLEHPLFSTKVIDNKNAFNLYHIIDINFDDIVVLDDLTEK